MIDKEAEIRDMKLHLLEEMAARGLTPADIGGAVKSAAVNMQAALGTEKSALEPLSAAAKSVTGAGGLAKFLLLGLAAAASGAGVGAGYLGERILGPAEEDIEEARYNNMIDSLQRATTRMNAETSARKAIRNAEEDDENDRRSPGRGPTLQIRSAV